MRIKEAKPACFVSQMRCDRCDAEAHHDDGDRFNNFLQIEFDSILRSSIGGGKHFGVGLCHACLKQTLGPWLRLSDAVCTGGAGDSGLIAPYEDSVEMPYPPMGRHD